jgi:hypothetical protein
MVEKMDSPESKNLSDKREPLASDLKLPVFDKPQIEPWPVKMSWAAAMRHLAPSRSHFRQGFDSPEKRLREKNPAPFVLP